MIGQAHFLEEVIDNIEHIDSQYYQKRTITFIVKEMSPLWTEFSQKKKWFESIIIYLYMIVLQGILFA